MRPQAHQHVVSNLPFSSHHAGTRYPPRCCAHAVRKKAARFCCCRCRCVSRVADGEGGDWVVGVEAVMAGEEAATRSISSPSSSSASQTLHSRIFPRSCTSRYIRPFTSNCCCNAPTVSRTHYNCRSSGLPRPQILSSCHCCGVCLSRRVRESARLRLQGRVCMEVCRPASASPAAVALQASADESWCLYQLV